MGKILCLAVALLLVLAAPTERAWGQVFQDDPAQLAIGAGYFDFIEQDDPSAEFRVDYRSDLHLWHFRPWLGLQVNTDGGLWGGAGALIDLHFGNFVLTPSAGIGGWSEGDSRDLGSVLEFRTQAELAYQFDDRSRLALYFSHLSNAGIGDSNPGTEIIGLYYIVPTDWLF